jgi:GTP-binding protein
MGADDEQLEFPVIYASGLNGWASYTPEVRPGDTMKPLLDTIIQTIPAPNTDVSLPLQFQPSLLDYNDYVGRMGIGRIQSGKMHVNDIVSCVRLDGSFKEFRIQNCRVPWIGTNRDRRGVAGDIVAIAGLPIFMWERPSAIPVSKKPLPKIEIGLPTVQMTFGTNTSPFAGREGKFVTSTKIQERLYKETQKDLALKIERLDASEQWIVSGRGELHLGILIENMRREGFEFQVSQAKVIERIIDGKKCEPFESVQVDCPLESMGPAWS